MNRYQKEFMKVLSEEDEVELSPDQQAMQGTLDPESNITDFDISAPSREAQRLKGISNAAMLEYLHRWIADVENFVEFLNGTSPQSMQAILHAAMPDTVFEKISNAETKKIARVAMELSSLGESLKGYLVVANDPKFRGV